MSQTTAIRLVKSLSGPEKRSFKLYARRQSGSRDYLDLFNIIDDCSNPETTRIAKAYAKKHSSASLHSAARYLVKVLTDCLIQLKWDKDPLFQSLQGIMRVRVLLERSLPEEGHRELKKIRAQAQVQQQHFIEYITYRSELNHLSDANFPDMGDRALVETQMKAKSLLRNLNHIHDHHSLLELLKYRLVHAGKISSEENKKKLNDLVLSEMALVSGKSEHSFAAQKLHLLFQSFFFTDIGDYRSALKTFASLNRLFEQHLSLLDNPPLDYLSALSGILDSLHMLKHHEQTPFYIEKVMQMDRPDYPEYFRCQVRKTTVVYQLIQLLVQQKFREAVNHLRTLPADLLSAYHMVNEEKQWELYFFSSLAHLGLRDWKKAHQYVNDVMLRHAFHTQWLICKATRLLNIIIYYEKGDTDYIDYEIRSYRRLFGKQQLLRSEMIFFKFIKICPDVGRKKLPDLQHKKLLQEITSVQKDPYERQLDKYFDLIAWVSTKLARS
jgi:hypothetical protein